MKRRDDHIDAGGLDESQTAERVGPVLVAGALSEAVIAAIRRDNARVEVVDRGSYWRVSSPRRCLLNAASVSEQLGEQFRLPADLEKIMCSFTGKLSISDQAAIWEMKS